MRNFLATVYIITLAAQAIVLNQIAPTPRVVAATGNAQLSAHYELLLWNPGSIMHQILGLCMWMDPIPSVQNTFRTTQLFFSVSNTSFSHWLCLRVGFWLTIPFLSRSLSHTRHRLLTRHKVFFCPFSKKRHCMTHAAHCVVLVPEMTRKCNLVNRAVTLLIIPSTTLGNISGINIYLFCWT